MDESLKNTSLGKHTEFVDEYDPQQLYAIPRKVSREGLGITEPLPFEGEDIWNAYELSWLDAEGKPQVAIAEVRVPASSPYLVESKSFKLYLNSFANTRFDTWDAVAATIKQDISATAEATATVLLLPLDEAAMLPKWNAQGVCLDTLPLLQAADEDGPVGKPWLELDAERKGEVSETFYSHLLRSLCPVTGQPDWAMLEISYRGAPISAQHLLQYLVSFRQQTGFHERIVEQTFMDISAVLKPEELLVSARFTRRGGLDINPYRSSTTVEVANLREIRQ
ncbi:MAG TPA: NADPH-dependent 7-cyano-7-deazaguanine reductase QueF [Alcanivoracaceae bacterium]|nr:NADPH-dependent 7-cyano-7-deazaguanine reductase QueF [Alcanivoracaceae bacterium]